LADLVDRIGQVYAFHHERATTAARRLRLRPSEDGPPRPRLYHAELVEIGHLGPEDDPQRTTATLQFSAEAAELLGSAVRGTVAWTPQGLEVMLSRFAEATPPLTVEVEGAAMASRMTSRGRALHAIVTWSEPGLPQRLVFRVASADSSPAEDGDE